MDRADSVSAIAHVTIRDSLFPEEKLLQQATESINGRDLERAKELTNLAIGMNPWDSEAYAIFGTIMNSDGKFDSAAYYYQIAHTMNPYRSTFLVGLGMAYLKLNNLHQSESVFLRAKELDSSDYNPPYGLYRTYRLLARIPESKQYLIEAGRKRNAPLFVQKELFHQYLNSSNPQMAVRYMARTRDISKDTSLIRLLMERLPGYSPTSGYQMKDN